MSLAIELPQARSGWRVCLSCMVYLLGVVAVCAGAALQASGMQQAGSVTMIVGLMVATSGRLASCCTLRLGKFSWLLLLTMPMDIAAVILMLICEDHNSTHWLGGGLLVGSIALQVALGFALIICARRFDKRVAKTNEFHGAVEEEIKKSQI